jgi:4'-phosphopantetheinyl transferase
MYSCLHESAVSPVKGVRLWTAHLESLSFAEVEELGAHLDATERTRAARFHFQRDRQHYLAARGLLRCLLGRILELPPTKIAFEVGAHGKPALDRARRRDSMVHFNLSHSAGWAMFALAQNREVGIDMESAARLERNEEDLVRLAARVLSTSELEIWQTLPDLETRQAAFLRAWTRKEAYSKATGQGLFNGFGDIEVALDAAAPQASLVIHSFSKPSDLTSNWILHDLAAPAGFAAALACEQRTEENVAGGDGIVFGAEAHA